MPRTAATQVHALEDLPNIGRAIATDLRKIGIQTPSDLYHRDPLLIFDELAKVMGPRHDPCVFYTLLAVKHFAESGKATPWWTFTNEGKKILACRSSPSPQLGAVAGAARQ